VGRTGGGEPKKTQNDRANVLWKKIDYEGNKQGILASTMTGRCGFGTGGKKQTEKEGMDQDAAGVKGSGTAHQRTENEWEGRREIGFRGKWKGKGCMGGG